jgi:hypothetical protein
MVHQQNENQQSHEESYNKSQNEDYNETKMTQTNNTGWQLKALASGTTAFGDYIVTTFRSCGKYWEKMRLISHLLQDRYSQ